MLCGVYDLSSLRHHSEFAAVQPYHRISKMADLRNAYLKFLTLLNSHGRIETYLQISEDFEFAIEKNKKHRKTTQVQ